MISMRTALATATLAAPLLLGCGAATGDATMLGLPAEVSGAAVYTVPADPTVTFPVSKVKVEQVDGIVSVYYELPADFAAQSSDIKLSGFADGTATVHLSGDAGTSTCTVASAVLVCNEDLSGLRFDPSQVMANPTDPLAAAIAAFMSEPIGVLTMALSGSSSAPLGP
jgi:hypothetical protein